MSSNNSTELSLFQENNANANTCQMSYNAIKSTIMRSKFILKSLWAHPEYRQYQPQLRRLFAAELGVCLLTVLIDVGISFPMQWAFTALDENKTASDIGANNNGMHENGHGISFMNAIIIYSIFAIISAPLHGIEYYTQLSLYLKFREATAKCLLHDFHAKNAFYFLATATSSSKEQCIDNPGQRYEIDLDWWTWSITLLLFHIIRQTVTIIAIIIVMVHLGVNLVLYAFIGAVFVTIGCLAFFGAAITQLQTIINEKKASYRAGLVRTSDNAEAITLYHAEKFEEKWSFQRLLSLVKYEKLYYKIMSILEFILNATSTVGLMLPVFLLAPRFFAGKITLGVITQSAYGFQQLLVSLTTIVAQMDKIGSIQATSGRLFELMTGIDKVVTTMNNPPVIHKECLSSRSNLYTSTTNTPMNIVVQKDTNNDSTSNDYLKGISFQNIDENDTDTYLKVENLSVVVPKSETLLLSHLSLSVKKSESLLIVGPSGAGKSSLIRVFAKLWKFGDGSVSSLTKDFMFLPQRPYLPILPPTQNTLENQLLFPRFNQSSSANSQTQISEHDLKTLLTKLNLSYILNYDSASNTTNDSKDWSKLLSLGEQQRLAIGRILLKQPKLVFLDEATSALDTENQSQMYKLLQEYGITFVSVGHRPNLYQFHENVLIITGDGTWKYMNSQQYYETCIENDAGLITTNETSL